MIIDICIMSTCIIDTCIIDMCILENASWIHAPWIQASWIQVSWIHASWIHERWCWSTLRRSHGLSARRAQGIKSRGPKGLHLEVEARRAPQTSSISYCILVKRYWTKILHILQRILRQMPTYHPNWIQSTMHIGHSIVYIVLYIGERIQHIHSLVFISVFRSVFILFVEFYGSRTADETCNIEKFLTKVNHRAPPLICLSYI